MQENDIHTFVVLAYKESKYLEECLKSVLNQSLKTNVVIATSTPNEYITELGEKYNIIIIVNENKNKGIGYDFDFAKNCVKTELVTIAHQDDIYDYNFAEEVIEAYKKYAKSIIIFPNYYEIKKNEKITDNRNLKIKRILLLPLRIRCLSNTKFMKRNVLRFGNAIGCPSVSFVNKNCLKNVFKSDMKCNIDWLAWERLSKLDGYFIYINKYLMGHRIHEESTTTKIIGDNQRTIEDLIMYKKFWPSFIAKIFNKFYKNAEKNNNVN